MEKIYSFISSHKVLTILIMFLLIIICFIIKNIFFTKRLDIILRKKFREEKINTNDLMNDLHKSKPLYDKLKVKIHPDRFIGLEEKRILIEQLSQKLRENKNNYNALIQVEKEFDEIFNS